jgi:hypothetical protein
VSNSDTVTTSDSSADQNGDVPVSAAGCPVLIPTVVSLIEQMVRAHVPWCYWKSGRRAPAALSGQSDLDVLVSLESQHAARRVLLDCGFRLFPSVASRDDPAIQSFLAHDDASGTMIHVHFHTRLMVGGALFKNYRLPWEQRLVSRAAPGRGLPMPLLDPASEAVLLVVRACLELRRTDPVVARKWASTTRKFALDRADLVARVARTEVRARAAELLGDDLADPVANALFDARPLQNQFEVRRRVRRALARCRTYNRVEAPLRASWRALQWVVGGLNQRLLQLPRPWSKRAPGGGIVIAILGVDGSGKSTLVRGLRAWLEPDVDVLTLYFGTGDGRPSWFLLPLKLLVPLASLMLRRKPHGSSHGAVTDAAPGAAYSLLLGIWATVLAIEKRMKLRAARRAAARGMIVITDRYPQDQITDFNDGPLLPRLSHVPRWLRKFEASAYALAGQLPPDLVIKLVAAPELIAIREPTMNAAVIHLRTAAMARLTFPGSSVAAVPAGQPREDVLRAAKAEIWRVL